MFWIYMDCGAAWIIMELRRTDLFGCNIMSFICFLRNHSLAYSYDVSQIHCEHKHLLITVIFKIIPSYSLI